MLSLPDTCTVHVCKSNFKMTFTLYMYIVLNSAHLYAALLDDIMVLQRRGLELHEFYAKKIYAEEHYEVLICTLL